jgi:hypothetical protein
MVDSRETITVKQEPVVWQVPPEPLEVVAKHCRP